jgi:hypothetical protein
MRSYCNYLVELIELCWIVYFLISQFDMVLTAGIETSIFDVGLV